METGIPENDNENINVNIEYYVNSIPPNNITGDLNNNFPNNYLNIGMTELNQLGFNCPEPILSNESINYSGITNTDDIFNNKVNIFESSSIKEIKGKVLDIFLNKSDFEDEEYNELNYENKEIDDMVELIDKYNEDFKNIQNDLDIADTKLNEEIKNMNIKLKKLDHFIDFVDKLDDNIEGEDKDELVSQINKISKKISKPDSFIEAKKKYIEQRKKLLKYIHLFRKINKWNIVNLCSVCLETPVDHYLDPCGHTFCKKCIKEQFKINELDEIKIYSQRNNFKCLICRSSPINDAKPLYFL